jgi:hypothetical protein
MPAPPFNQYLGIRVDREGGVAFGRSTLRPPQQSRGAHGGVV